MKQITKNILKSLGIEAKRIVDNIPGSVLRPIGNDLMFLEDIRERGFQPRGILDVGANCGDWTTMALSVFPESNVIMIEPQEEMRPHLEKVCHENPGVEFILAGAGKEPGELIQTIWEDLAGSSFLPEVDEDQVRTGKQRLTPIVTIDDILSERPDFKPDFVKLDIQGFEIEALKGSMSIFGRTEVFILETSLYPYSPNQPITADIIQFMREQGYEIYDITSYYRRPYDGALGQIDLAFSKIGGMLRENDSWDAEPTNQ